MMTNGDVIRSKITDRDIAYYTECGDCGNSLIACQSSDGKTLAEAINKCNDVLKNKPELDFSGVEFVK